MALGRFLRTDKEPMRIRIGNSIETIHKNEIIIAEYEVYKDIWGFRFLGWYIPEQGSANLELLSSPSSEVQIVTQSISVTKEEPVSKTDKVEEFEEVTESEEDSLKETIEEVKNLNNKQLFVIKKEKMYEYMSKLGIDYSSISENRNDVLSFFKKKIKEL